MKTLRIRNLAGLSNKSFRSHFVELMENGIPRRVSKVLTFEQAEKEKSKLEQDFPFLDIPRIT